MVNSLTTVSSLHRITKLPIDLNNPFYTHYPSLKLGVDESVVHYGKLLAPVAKQLILANLDYTDWVLTAPAYNALPAAANLLCWCVYDLLKDQLPPSITLSVLDIHESNRFLEPESQKKADDYSKLSQEERIKSRERSNQFIIPEPAFCDRAVIFVNDINVTGTQQKFMQRYFESVQAAIVQWLYVIDVEKSIGESEPQLEYSINYSKIASFEEFAQIIAHANIQYTAKCVWRLLAYSVPELDQLFRTLDDNRKSRILQLALEEGLSKKEIFQKKIALLKVWMS